MNDFQNIEFAQSHLKLARCEFKPRMDRLLVAKQTIQLRGTCLANKSRKPVYAGALYKSSKNWKIDPLIFMNPYRLVNLLRFMNLLGFMNLSWFENLWDFQLKFIFIESFQRFITIHEFQSDLPNANKYMTWQLLKNRSRERWTILLFIII